MDKQDFKFISSDGKQISASLWKPTDSVRARGLIQIIHGLTDHRHRYDSFADYFCNAGFICFAEDHQGHGETISVPSERGYFADKDGWHKVSEDNVLLAGRVKNDFPDLPLFLFGFSMGSAIARTYMIDNPEMVQGVILAGVAAVPSSMILSGTIVSSIEGLFKGYRKESPRLNHLSFGQFNKPFRPAFISGFRK